MARNGSGTYVLPAGNPVVTNTTISSSWANGTLSDIASAITQSIAKDGQTVATANLPMGGFKHTNVAPAAQANEYATLAQVQATTASYLVGVSGGDTITASGAPPVTVYTTGNNYRFKAAATNATTNVTINIDSVGVIPLKRNDGQAVGIGGIVSGEIVEFTYDGTNGIITSTSMSLADGGTGGLSRASGLNNLLPTQVGKSGNFLKTTTVSYTTVSRARASNVATVVITPTTAMPSVGDQVVIAGLPSAYNGTVTLTAVGVSSISYANTGSDEANTADTAGTVNNYVAEFLPQSTFDVRQTVLVGTVDSNGQSSFGGSTGSATVTTSTALSITSANGKVDTFLEITNPSWTGLNVNGTGYLWIDTVAGTTGFTSLPVNYIQGNSYSTTNNQYTFSISEMTMKVGNGSSATQVNRVFVGEVTIAGNVVTAITWYALRGEWSSPQQAIPAANTALVITHNLGIKPRDMNPVLEFIATDAGYSIGDEIDLPGIRANSPFWSAFQSSVDYKTFSTIYPTGTGGLYIWNKSTSAAAALDTTKSRIKLYVNRGW